MKHSAILALLAAASACRGGHDEAAAAPAGNPNVALLTKDQIAQMKIVVEKVDLQDVDDTVLASGKVAFDDQKVLHVFSPVTGKAINVHV